MKVVVATSVMLSFISFWRAAAIVLNDLASSAYSVGGSAEQAVNLYAAGLAALVTLYFWWRNTRGLHESSDDALRIMYVTTVMVVALIAWSGLTILARPAQRRLPPAPVTRNLSFNHDAVGWL